MEAHTWYDEPLPAEVREAIKLYKIGQAYGGRTPSEVLSLPWGDIQALYYHTLVEKARRDKHRVYGRLRGQQIINP